MKRSRAISVATVLVAGGLIAGCGSGSKTPTTHASTPAKSSTPVSGGAYGASSSGSSGATKVALITTKKHGDLGPVLAYGPKKMTVYLFEADNGGKSHCSGTCASAWPPIIGQPQAGGSVSRGKLGTVTRPDGRTQVTYNGHPLYLFIKDKDDGDAYGEGAKAFGAEWYVLAPSGSKVDKS